jgi:hypothetical protein
VFTALAEVILSMIAPRPKLSSSGCAITTSALGQAGSILLA